MRRFLLLLGIFLMNMNVEAAPIKLMVFGDSLSVGHNIEVKDSFWAQLRTRLRQDGHDVHVINQSKSGETTTGAIQRVRNAIKRKPDGVLLQLGSNDMFQHFPLETTRQNLQTLIDSFKKAEIPVLLVGMEAPLSEPEEYRDEIRNMYVDLAKENDLLLYPFFMDGLWKENGEHLSESYFLADGIHPTSKGVEIMVQRIVPIVVQFLNEDVLPKKTEDKK